MGNRNTRLLADITPLPLHNTHLFRLKARGKLASGSGSGSAINKVAEVALFSLSRRFFSLPPISLRSTDINVEINQYHSVLRCGFRQ